MTGKISFGAVIPRYGLNYDGVRDYMLQVRQMGFKSLWVTDHLMPRRGSSLLECWTMLTAASMEVKDLRIGTTVLCHSYRHPALLATMAATLDQISDGRLDLGLGSGSSPQVLEHKMFGIPFSQKGRTEEFKEYVEVVRLLLSSNDTVNYSGQHYTLNDALLSSHPIQKPYPPITIAARMGKMLRLVAELGEGWNFYGESVEEFKDAKRIIDETCDSAGKPPIKQIIGYSGIVTYTTEEQERRRIDPIKSGALSSEDAYKQSHTIVHGTPDECLSHLEGLLEVGAQSIILYDRGPGLENLKLAAESILPSFN